MSCLLVGRIILPAIADAEAVRIVLAEADAAAVGLVLAAAYAAAVGLVLAAAYAAAVGLVLAAADAAAAHPHAVIEHFLRCVWIFTQLFFLIKVWSIVLFFL